MKKTIIAAALMALLVPSLSFASIDVNLKYGSRGQAVVELQEFLITKGYLNSEATGNFYSLTKAAVVAYQKAEGITPAAGFVGPVTRAKINAFLAVDNSQELAETGTTTVAQADSATDMLKKQNEILQQQLDQLKTLGSSNNNAVSNAAKRKPTTVVYAKLTSAFKHTGSTGTLTNTIIDAPYGHEFNIETFSPNGTKLIPTTSDNNCYQNFSDGIKRCTKVEKYENLPAKNADGSIMNYTISYSFNSQTGSISAGVIDSIRESEAKWAGAPSSVDILYSNLEF